MQSRYYDPEVGRFINADAFASTGQGLLGNNMFAYCLNNPVRYTDYQGFMVEDHLDSDGEPLSSNDLEERSKGGGRSTVNTCSSTNTVIYRYGGTNPGNLVPRQRDASANSGLSFSTEYRPGAAMTTTDQVNSTGVLYAVQDGPHHVSVYPVNATVSDWYYAGRDSIWTITLREIVAIAK